MTKEIIIRPRHREVLKKMVKNGEITKAEAMREVGYKEGYILDGNINKTDSWQELMRKYLPDEFLAKKHKELLNKREVKRVFNPEIGEFIDIETNQVDTQAVARGLDMGYKLKGKYTAEKHEIVLPKPILDLDE